MKEYLIYWSPIAEESYLQTLSHIHQKWTVREANNFAKKVESLISKLKKFKHLCPRSNMHKNLRRCTITAQTSLVYRVKNEIIELVAFFDNRSESRF